jgi:hypothetical protein
VALEQRQQRLHSGIDPEARKAELLRLMEEEIWSQVPPELRGQPHDSARDDAIIGYGPDGVPE